MKHKRKKTHNVEHRGYTASYRWVGDHYYGTISNIDDLVTFEGSDKVSVMLALDEAISDYEYLKKEVGK